MIVRRLHGLSGGIDPSLEETKTRYSFRIGIQCYRHSTWSQECAAMEGLIKEGEEVRKALKTVPSGWWYYRSRQKVEHYEIASRNACAFAKIWTRRNRPICSSKLERRKAADDKLSEIAETSIIWKLPGLLQMRAQPVDYYLIFWIYPTSGITWLVFTGPAIIYPYHIILLSYHAALPFDMRYCLKYSNVYIAYS